MALMAQEYGRVRFRSARAGKAVIRLELDPGSSILEDRSLDAILPGRLSGFRTGFFQDQLVNLSARLEQGVADQPLWLPRGVYLVNGGGRLEVRGGDEQVYSIDSGGLNSGRELRVGPVWSPLFALSPQQLAFGHRGGAGVVAEMQVPAPGGLGARPVVSLTWCPLTIRRPYPDGEVGDYFETHGIPDLDSVAIDDARAQSVQTIVLEASLRRTMGAGKGSPLELGLHVELLSTSGGVARDPQGVGAGETASSRPGAWMGAVNGFLGIGIGPELQYRRQLSLTQNTRVDLDIFAGTRLGHGLMTGKTEDPSSTDASEPFVEPEGLAGTGYIRLNLGMRAALSF
jgi:hypothetical protein